MSYVIGGVDINPWFDRIDNWRVREGKYQTARDDSQYKHAEYADRLAALRAQQAASDAAAAAALGSQMRFQQQAAQQYGAATNEYGAQQAAIARYMQGGHLGSQMGNTPQDRESRALSAILGIQGNHMSLGATGMAGATESAPRGASNGSQGSPSPSVEDAARFARQQSNAKEREMSSEYDAKLAAVAKLRAMGYSDEAILKMLGGG